MKKRIKKHLRILLAGVLYALKSAVAVAVLALSIALLCNVRYQNGYLAVCKFVIALHSLALSSLIFYSCGHDLLKGKFSK